MSTELKTVSANHNSREVSVTSFFGGANRGQCLQLTQSRNGSTFNVGVVDMTEAQVREAVARMTEWLER